MRAGTGKTTTARKMGQVYYDMGFLSSVEVVECSASDLVGEYVGQTGPKTKKLFERALGKVLFIDEAYRLSEGHFAKEAMDELVGILTQDAFIGKLIVIIAGYDQEMNNLLAVNPGLSSRFPEEIYFDNLTPERCLEILSNDLSTREVQCAALTDPSSNDYSAMVKLVNTLSSLDSWGNARDMKTLSKQMVRVAYKQVATLNPGDKLVLDGRDAVECISTMLKERHSRSTNVPVPSSADRTALPPQRLHSPPQILTPPTTTTSTSISHAVEVEDTPSEAPTSEEEVLDSVTRDAGVSDAVWAQLQADKQLAEEVARQQDEKICALQNALEEHRKADEAAKAREAKLARRARAAADAEVKRRLEEERLKLIAIAIEEGRRAKEFAERRRKEMEAKAQEEKAQQKLRSMGVCPAGFHWIKQTSGYRCAGGSHFVTNAQLGM